MSAIKNINQKLKDLSQIKKIIFLIMINLSLIIVYQLDFSSTKLNDHQVLNDYSNVFSIYAKINVHPLFRGKIELIDESSKTSLGQYDLINIENNDEFEKKKVYLQSKDKNLHLNLLTKKSIMVTPIGFGQKKKNVRSSYDQSF